MSDGMLMIVGIVTTVLLVSCVVARVWWLDKKNHVPAHLSHTFDHWLMNNSSYRCGIVTRLQDSLSYFSKLYGTSYYRYVNGPVLVFDVYTHDEITQTKIKKYIDSRFADKFGSTIAVDVKLVANEQKR